MNKNITIGDLAPATLSNAKIRCVRPETYTLEAQVGTVKTKNNSRRFLCKADLIGIPFSILLN